MEQALHLAAQYIALVLEALALLVIAIGAVEAAIRTFLTFFLDRDIELEYRRAGGSDAGRT
jgi:uncharacterized membrane protein